MLDTLGVNKNTQQTGNLNLNVILHGYFFKVKKKSAFVGWVSLLVFYPALRY